MLVLHAPDVPGMALLAKCSPPLLPQKKLFTANGPHFFPTSHTLLVVCLPLSPALLVALACVEFPPRSRPPLVVALGTTTPPHAENELTTTMFVCLPDVGFELGRNLPMLVGNFGVLVCFGTSFMGFSTMMNSPPEAPPLASLPRMVIGLVVSLPCGLGVCLGDLGVCLGSFGKARTGHPLVAAPGSVLADAEAFAATCDGREIGRKLLSGRFNQGGFGHHIFLKGRHFGCDSYDAERHSYKDKNAHW